MSFLTGSQVLFSTTDTEIKELVTRAQWPDNVEISFVEDVFDALFGETELPVYGCLIIDAELKVIEEIRHLGIKLPILSLLSDASVGARIAVLEIGSDDCLGPSFSVSELVARTQALCRRGISVDRESRPAAGGLSLCPETQTATLEGKSVPLTPTETQILRFLLENHGRVVSAEQVGMAVWGASAGISQNLVCVHLTNLRQKLSGGLLSTPIRTIRGRGYMMSDEYHDSRHLKHG